MITGTVNADFEPIVPLSIRRADGEIFTQEAIVDTGFNGWLSLPPEGIDIDNLTCHLKILDRSRGRENRAGNSVALRQYIFLTCWLVLLTPA